MILITGSAGYIGSHISTYFEKKNIKYIGIDNLSYSYKKNISKNQKHFFFDISNKTKLSKLINKFKPSTVIHCAASSYVLEAEKNKDKYFQNNIIKTKKFIDICKEYKIKNFIFMSSSNVYKEKLNNKVFSENNPTSPKNFYGKNKIYIEKYLKKKSFDNLIILRLFNVIGIFNKKFKPFVFKNENYQRLIFKILQNYKQKKITNLNFYKDKKQVKFPARDFIDIKDVSKIINKIIIKISNKKKFLEILNVGSGQMITIDKIVNQMNMKYCNKLKINLIPIENKELIITKSSINKLKKLIRYTPKINLKNSIRSHYE